MPYTFTNSWFTDKHPVIDKYFKPTTQPCHILEIGAYEGAGTTFYIDNYLDHPQSSITSIDPFDPSDVTSPVHNDTYIRFLTNIIASKYPHKSKVHKDYSRNILPLLMIGTQKFDFISVDGGHLAEDVLVDAVLSFHLLKPNGLIFFDDYPTWLETKGPKNAIDAFLDCYSKHITVLHKGYHVLVRKIS